MDLRAQIVPWSSVVGQSVQLIDRTSGHAIGQLAIRGGPPLPEGKSIRQHSADIAQAVAEAFAARIKAKGAPEPKDQRPPEVVLVDEILAELRRARTKFPGDNVTTVALVEEVGELGKALIDESRERVREEAVQVAVMAMRVVLDGDSSLDEWRHAKGLDALVV